MHGLNCFKINILKLEINMNEGFIEIQILILRDVKKSKLN